MKDFWRSCGYRLLERTASGNLVVTDAFIRHLLHTPEMTPIAESGPAEIALHEALLAQPRMEVTSAQLAAIEDEDARSNYEIWLRFRARLLAHETLDASYRALFEGDGVDVPPVFVQQLTQIMLRHVIGDDASVFEARAAEMLFRAQRIAIQDDGQVMAADDETVERHAIAANFGTLGELLKQGGATLRTAELDVLTDARADDYWERDESHDMVLALTHGEPGLEALCRVLEAWVSHFIGSSVRVTVERDIDDANWVWHVGLDAQASSVLNDLFQGHEVDNERMARMLCLFALHFDEPSIVQPVMEGKPVYLAMAMDDQKRLKLKPQNLLLNLPLAVAS
ncbi:MAG: DUF6352 family protein [Ramlibacter sp.]|nr:DUF6352 family protein [Ramlibacter sp.]